MLRKPLKLGSQLTDLAGQGQQQVLRCVEPLPVSGNGEGAKAGGELGEVGHSSKLRQRRAISTEMRVETVEECVPR